jgi:hypothetical protein
MIAFRNAAGADHPHVIVHQSPGACGVAHFY